MSLVYFISDKNKGPIKIGFTSHNTVDSRLNGLQTSNPLELICEGQIEGDERLERELHDKFEHIRIRGEWFERTPELLQFISDNTMSQREIQTRLKLRKREQEIEKLENKIESLKEQLFIFEDKVEQVTSGMTELLTQPANSVLQFTSTVERFVRDYFEFNKDKKIDQPCYMFMEFHKDLRRIIEHSFDLEWTSARTLLSQNVEGDKAKGIAWIRQYNRKRAEDVLKPLINPQLSRGRRKDLG